MRFVLYDNTMKTPTEKQDSYLTGSNVAPKGSFPSSTTPRVSPCRKSKSGGSCVQVLLVQSRRTYVNLTETVTGSKERGLAILDLNRRFNREEVNPHLCVGRVESNLRKTNLSSPEQDSNPDLLDSLDQHNTNTLASYTTEAGVISDMRDCVPHTISLCGQKKDHCGSMDPSSLSADQLLLIGSVLLDRSAAQLFWTHLPAVVTGYTPALLPSAFLNRAWDLLIATLHELFETLR
uniref:Uncharacterized protein n=1 Tax=Timema cristinae TaxID=61476 RepID=A0A7R9GVM2_TIMCR|nr:unnamed protein product [Timema cristinae]